MSISHRLLVSYTRAKCPFHATGQCEATWRKQCINVMTTVKHYIGIAFRILELICSLAGIQIWCYFAVFVSCAFHHIYIRKKPVEYIVPLASDGVIELNPHGLCAHVAISLIFEKSIYISRWVGENKFIDLTSLTALQYIYIWVGENKFIDLTSLTALQYIYIYISRWVGENKFIDLTSLTALQYIYMYIKAPYIHLNLAETRITTLESMENLVFPNLTRIYQMSS